MYTDTFQTIVMVIGSAVVMVTGMNIFLKQKGLKKKKLKK
jgi:hypothetical protein